MKQELILEQMQIMGFELVKIEDGCYLFEYKELKCLLRTDDDNEEFLSVSIPVFDEFTDKNKMTVYETTNLINTLVRYVKLTIQEEHVSAIYEHRLADNDDLEELLEDIVHALSTAVYVYMKKMRGDKIPYLDYDPENDDAGTDESTDDYDVESELEKLLENIDD